MWRELRERLIFLFLFYFQSFRIDFSQGGTILDDVMERPRRVRKIHRRLNMFLDLVQSDPTLKSTLLPLGDGVILIQKLEEKDFKYILEEL